MKNMKNGLFKKWLAAVACLLALGATTALAEPDSFGLGTGRDGALAAPAGSTTINRYAPVTAPLAAGDTSITIGTAVGPTTYDFGANTLVMVLQTTGIVPVPGSGGTTPIDLTNDAVGRWELARLASATGTTLTLQKPLIRSYASGVTQVIRVPEFTTVTLAAASSRLIGTAWNGSAGGVVAFLATGAVTLPAGAQINALTLGFRGGQVPATDDDPSSMGCTGLDESPPLGGQKGEGIANVRYGLSVGGRGNVANGGGGGVCSKSGGGGGGNYGAGGVGGKSDVGDGERAVGGQGGSALTYSPQNHLILGGGGGAGHSSEGSGVAGGRGGGIIFIRAAQLAGSGSVSASGASAGLANADAGSGGGAGGTVYLRFSGTAACSTSRPTASSGVKGRP